MLPSSLNSKNNIQSDVQYLNSVKLVNRFVFILLPLFLFTTIYSLYFDFTRIVYTNGVYSLFITAVLLLNKMGRHSLAKTLFLCTNALVVITYHKLMDNETSMFFYFFPLLLCLQLFFKPKEEKPFLYFTIFFLVSIILLTIFLPSFYFKPFPLSTSVHLLVNRINSICCCIILVIYTYSIFKSNRKKELQLIAAKDAAEQAAKAKAIFLSTMSHELRTPLNGIVGTANLLSSGDLKDVTKQIDLIKNLSEHMLGLVNDVLDYSKIESGKLQLSQNSFNVKDSVLKLYNTFLYLFDAKGLHYKVNIDSRLKEFNVISDDMRLQQILYNLLSNALKFTESGSVHLNATLLNIDETNAKVRFAVTDTGIGIPKNKIESIFESFNQADADITRKYGGTGLGLTISNNLAKLFESALDVESVEGNGSIFSLTINFPINKKNIVSNDSIESKILSIKDKKILLAEDNPVNMMVAKMMLQKWGVIVTEAANGKIGVEKCKEDTFDLILLDLEMPIMDGRTALKEIRDFGITTPIIAFTAGLYDNMEADLLNKGFTGYALKPFKPEELQTQLAKILSN
jgi:signal transduction histidine kinase/CheY-like chemotaxis protein